METESTNQGAYASENRPLTTCSPECERPATCPQTILLVEDDASVRDVLGEVLESVGYHVLKTQCAEEALELYQSHSGELDLLLTDVVMPGRSGRDLARELGKLSSGMKIILISGYGENAALLGTPRDARTSYLSKPFSLPELLWKVEAVLHGDRATPA
jgi:two-component system, cell cycle sensor histidine kinase and response regulator CckA